MRTNQLSSTGKCSLLSYKGSLGRGNPDLANDVSHQIAVFVFVPDYSPWSANLEVSKSAAFSLDVPKQFNISGRCKSGFAGVDLQPSCVGHLARFVLGIFGPGMLLLDHLPIGHKQFVSCDPQALQTNKLPGEHLCIASSKHQHYHQHISLHRQQVVCLLCLSLESCLYQQKMPSTIDCRVIP